MTNGSSYASTNTQNLTYTINGTVFTSAVNQVKTEPFTQPHDGPIYPEYKENTCSCGHQQDPSKPWDSEDDSAPHGTFRDCVQFLKEELLQQQKMFTQLEERLQALEDED